MRLFDTHCHIGLINSDQTEQLMVVQFAKRAGINNILSICNSLLDFEQTYNNLRSAKNVFHAVGVSPTESGNRIDGWETRIQDFLKLDRVVAIGETGLDYEKNFAPRQTQVDLFIKHLEIARRANLPVIIHNRRAGKDILDVLKDNIPEKGAIFHCYSEDWEFARSALDLPVYFSFAGNLTFKNIKELSQTVKNLPEDRILIESEAPFMTPQKYSGKAGKKKRNKPEYMIETALEVANIRAADPEQMAEVLYQNSVRAFNLQLDGETCTTKQ